MKKNIVEFLEKNLGAVVVFMAVFASVPELLFSNENCRIVAYLTFYLSSLFILLIQFFIWKKNKLNKNKLIFFTTLLVANIAIVLIPILSPISFSGALPDNAKDLVIGIALIITIVMCIFIVLMQILIWLIILIKSICKNHW